MHQHYNDYSHAVCNNLVTVWQCDHKVLVSQLRHADKHMTAHVGKNADAQHSKYRLLALCLNWCYSDTFPEILQLQHMIRLHSIAITAHSFKLGDVISTKHTM